MALIAANQTAAQDQLNGMLRLQKANDAEWKKMLAQRAETESKISEALEIVKENLFLNTKSREAAEKCIANGTKFLLEDVAPRRIVEAPPTHTEAFNAATIQPTLYPTPQEARLPATAPMTSVKPPSPVQASAENETADDDFVRSYAQAVKERTKFVQQQTTRKAPSPRHRTPLQDAEGLVGICCTNMQHDNASTLRQKLKRLLDKHNLSVLHLRYLQKERIELVVPEGQAQAIINTLRHVGHTFEAAYTILSNQVRREADEAKRQRRNAYCALRAVNRTLSTGLGQRVRLYYEGQKQMILNVAPEVCSAAGQAEFDGEYGARPTEAHYSARDKCVPTDQ